MAYADVILAEASLIHYWKMDETGGTSMTDSKGSATGTISGATVNQAGPFVGSKSYRFAGSPAFCSIPVDLSAVGSTTVEFWLNWDTYTGADLLAYEYTPNWNTGGANGFICDPNDSAVGRMSFGFKPGGIKNNAQIVRPSATDWHYYACTFEVAADAALECVPYVDGQSVAYTKANSGLTVGGATYSNSTLYLMSRAGASLFGMGYMSNFALYNAVLDATAIQAHFDASTEQPDLGTYRVIASPRLR